MRRLIVTENITLDGVVDTMTEWFTFAGGDDHAAANQEHMHGADAVLLGRVTYQEFASFWPNQTADTTGVHDYLDRTHKYVVSTSLTDTEASWSNTTVLRGPVAAEIADLKARP